LIEEETVRSLTEPKHRLTADFICFSNLRVTFPIVGRTSQRLEDRIKQHIPKQIRNRTETEKQTSHKRMQSQEKQSNI